MCGSLDSQSDKQHVQAGPNHVGKVFITNQTKLLKKQHWSTAGKPREYVTNQNECRRINGREYNGDLNKIERHLGIDY